MNEKYARKQCSSTALTLLSLCSSTASGSTAAHTFTSECCAQPTGSIDYIWMQMQYFYAYLINAANFLIISIRVYI